VACVLLAVFGTESAHRARRSGRIDSAMEDDEDALESMDRSQNHHSSSKADSVELHPWLLLQVRTRTITAFRP